MAFCLSETINISITNDEVAVVTVKNIPTRENIPPIYDSTPNYTPVKDDWCAEIELLIAYKF